MVALGEIVVLNGVPRAGKSSIVRAIQESFDGVWINLGVDVHKNHIAPAHLQPGIGLRPAANRPDLETHLPALYAALFDSTAAHSRHGISVAVDGNLHDAYSRPLGTLLDAARRLQDLPAYFVGVHCPLPIVLERRDATWPGRREAMKDGATITTPYGEVPDGPVLYERYVHVPGLYDLEVDTSQLSPQKCAALIRQRIDRGRPEAFRSLLGVA